MGVGWWTGMPRRRGGRVGDPELRHRGVVLGGWSGLAGGVPARIHRLAAAKKAYDPAGLFFVHHGVGSQEWSDDGFTRLTR
jgi:hypothetical protein